MTATATTSLPRMQGVSAWIRHLRHALRLRREAMRTIDALSSLSDLELEDIGLTRGDITPVAWERACASVHD